MPKYSIILPVYNAEKYIRDSINTVLKNYYQDFEFIISNNCSTDGTERILNEIKDPRVKIIKPDTTLPLGAHWNFAIMHATGDWLWALGADDGMMPYFFEVCDKLVEICKKKNLNIIKTNRAYFYWPGCEKDYNNNHISYTINSSCEIKKTATVMEKMLAGKASYVDIPQMYISSLFSRKLIERALSYSKTHEIIPFNVPAQDAYLGVLGCMFENNYMYTDVPIGWVGTSTASMVYKVDRKELHYKDCSYSAFCSHVLSLIFHMHLAFRAFFENSTFKTEKFKKITSNLEILSRVYYLDLIELPAENNRVQSFFAYLSDMNIDKESVIKRARALKQKHKLYNLIQAICNVKPIKFIKKLVAFLYKKLTIKKSCSWSMTLNNSCFLSYEQINSLLKSEEHVEEIIRQIT